MTKNEAVFTKDLEKKTINVVRTFDASLDQVWQAWTDSEMLDKWWAPKPYKAVTKTMDFRVGGYWLYCMMGPQGDNSWCKESFKTIEPKKLIDNEVNFCDEEANVTHDFPTMYWTKKFNGDENKGTVTIEIRFETKEGMDKIIGMGFEGGFTMGMNNLDELLSA